MRIDIKVFIAAILMTIIVCGGAIAETAVDADAIPVPAGATVVTEINITDNDILGMLKTAVPAFTQSAAGAKGEIGELLKNLDPNSFIEAIAGIKSIRAVRFNLTAGTSADKIMSFYQGALTADLGWSRILYNVGGLPNAPVSAKTTIAVYTNGGQEYFGVIADPGKNVAGAFRTVGFIDVTKLAAWAGKTIQYFSTQEVKEVKKPAKPAK